MTLIDPGDPASWPQDVLDEIERLDGICREVNDPSIPSCELLLGSVDMTYQAEVAFRSLLDHRPVSIFHATRVLPHERERIRQEGLVVLDRGHRDRRLDTVIKVYGDDIGAERLEDLRHAGPLDWQNAQRLGLLFGVTPLQASFEFEGRGMTVFLEEWGGESFYWVNEQAVDRVETIRRLTDLSEPAVVEVGILAKDLDGYTPLWQVFVGQFGGWDRPYQVFHTKRSVPPERVIAILDPESPRWPLRTEGGTQS